MPDTTPRGRVARALQTVDIAEPYAVADLVIEALRRSNNREIRVGLANLGVQQAMMETTVQDVMTRILGKQRGTKTKPIESIHA